MINALAFCRKAEYALGQRWGYIWGTYGQRWTAEKQANTSNEQAKAYGSKWIGRRVSDCSGLPYWAVKSFMPDYRFVHGSNTQYREFCRNKGHLENGIPTDGHALRPGTLMFLTDKSGCRHHVGIYVGDNRVIEAKGTKSGVVVSAPSHWDDWGELKIIDFDGGGIDTETLKRGMDDDLVKVLQENLIRLGYDCGTADGIFGKRTEAAVMAFQEANGLEADGIAGPDTLRKISALLDGTEVDATKYSPDISTALFGLKTALTDAQKYLAVVMDIVNAKG